MPKKHQRFHTVEAEDAETATQIALEMFELDALEFNAGDFQVVRVDAAVSRAVRGDS